LRAFDISPQPYVLPLASGQWRMGIITSLPLKSNLPPTVSYTNL